MGAFGRKTYRINTSALMVGDMLWWGAVVNRLPVKLNDNSYRVDCIDKDGREVPQYLCDFTSIVDTVDNETQLKLSAGV